MCLSLAYTEPLRSPPLFTVAGGRRRLPHFTWITRRRRGLNECLSDPRIATDLDSRWIRVPRAPATVTLGVCRRQRRRHRSSGLSPRAARGLTTWLSQGSSFWSGSIDQPTQRLRRKLVPAKCLIDRHHRFLRRECCRNAHRNSQTAGLHHRRESTWTGKTEALWIFSRPASKILFSVWCEYRTVSWPIL